MATSIAEVDLTKSKKTYYKPSFKSWVWTHMSLIKEEKELAHCDVCKTELKYTGGTTSVLIKHLKRKHGIEPAPLDKVPQVDQAGLTQTAITSFVPQKELDTNCKRHREITDKLINIVVKDLRPLSIVEDLGMREALHYFEPRYKIICRTTLTKKLREKYDSVRACLESKVANADAISLTTDGWSSCNAEDYIAVTVHVISGWQLESYLLTVDLFSQNHTANNLTEHLTKTVHAWISLPDGQEKLYITTDNAANIVKGNMSTLFYVYCTL